MKGDYESMKKGAFRFAKEKYFHVHSDSRLEQNNFNRTISVIQDSADMHIPSNISRSVCSVPLLTPAIRRKICRKIQTNAKA